MNAFKATTELSFNGTIYRPSENEAHDVRESEQTIQCGFFIRRYLNVFETFVYEVAN